MFLVGKASFQNAADAVQPVQISARHTVVPLRDRLSTFFAAKDDSCRSAGRDSNALETGLGRSVAPTPGSLDVLQVAQLAGANLERRLAITALVPAGLGGLEIWGERGAAKAAVVPASLAAVGVPRRHCSAGSGHRLAEAHGKARAGPATEPATATPATAIIHTAAQAGTI